MSSGHKRDKGGGEGFRFGLVIPVLNARDTADSLLEAISRQSVRPDAFLVMDSSSTDGSPARFSAAGAMVHGIPREDFNHGGTRQLAVDLLPETDIVLFLTQDAIPADSDTFARLLRCFRGEKVGAAFGRQLPRPSAGPIEAHARLFNYPPRSRSKCLMDASELGIKTAFISNSFSAYRTAVLREMGGFPKNVIMCEDTCMAAKMLVAGWHVTYCAEAAVFHSHGYIPMDEMRRYFDLGVLHARESWIRESFGKAEGEGMKFIRSECRYLWKEAPGLLPSALFRAALKFAGYRLGLGERFIPPRWKIRFSLNRRFWL